MKFAVALAGGGTRGAYHIGVLKALREMDIGVSAVTGTSIGSINGAIFAQGDLDKASELWNSISIEQVIALSGEIAQGNFLDNIKSIFDFSKNAVSNRGFDITPLRELLTELVDEQKLRESDIDFGLTTFSVNDRTPIEMFKADIPQGKVVDYLLASSCLPGFFKTVEIDGKNFLDGGVTNNIPVSMLLGRGYRDIIAVEIRGIGIVKHVDTTGTNIITIRGAENVVGSFEFDRAKLEKTTRLGYLDALKAFGKLHGRRYYFPNDEYGALISRYSQSILWGLEYAAHLLSLDNTSIYGAQEFIGAVMDRFEQTQALYKDIRESLLGMNLPELLSNWKKEEALKHGLILPLMVDLAENDKSGVSRAMLKRLAGNEFTAAGSIMYIMASRGLTD